MRAGLFSGDALADPTSMRAAVLDSPGMAGADLAGAVSTRAPYTVAATGTTRARVAALDLGIKANTPRMLAERGIETRVLPSSASIDELLSPDEYGRPPDGVFLSNGPGDPAAAAHAVALTEEVLRREVPLFGICFGNQILARALGLGTYKMRYGHRGINVPVVDHTDGTVAITSQNHGFAVAGTPGRARRLAVRAGAPQPLVPQRRHRRGPDLRGRPRLQRPVPPGGRGGSARRGRPLRPFRGHDGKSLMPRREDIHHVLVIGSGPIVIGQAAEFDYSGTQACRVLREEGLRVSLVNSNPATIMTDPEIADATYVEPITVEYLTKVIEVERPDALLATLGGQTALNAAIALHDAGVLERFGVELIGADIDAIQRGEDRLKFKDIVRRIGGDVPRSEVCHSMADVRATVAEVGLPVVIRPSFTMGGLGSGLAYTPDELERLAGAGLAASPVHEVLIEESVLGWKEYELELMRDGKDNVVVVCSIENVDPMGVHTGDSVTVAPAMTLTDREYQVMRDTGIEVLRAVGVETGGCNIQFAVHPTTGRLVVIEMNPRVSRSSALASKATGFPIAKIAARLAVGYTLDEITNDITGETPASFEPTLDYVVVKVPRFAFEKFPGADPTLTTTMKSVGEAMALGRSFPEALNKALRSAETKAGGFWTLPDPDEDVTEALHQASLPRDGRLYAVERALRLGASVEQVTEASGIDGWFVEQIEGLVGLRGEIADAPVLDEALLRRAKRAGLSDAQVAAVRPELAGETGVRALRHRLGVRPVYKTVDTCAAEFEARTPYHYSAYESDPAAETEVVAQTDRPKVIILGSGPNRIGQGIEFDYSCVHAAFALRAAGFETVMLNCNPETVSTDYDTSDRLYFEPLTEEDVLEVVHAEQVSGLGGPGLVGVVVQLGGQTPLKLAAGLEAAGVPVVGTPPAAIDLAESRGAFGRVLDDAGLPAPPYGMATSFDGAREIAASIGYPVLVRPVVRARRPGHGDRLRRRHPRRLHRPRHRGHPGPPGAGGPLPRRRHRDRRRRDLRRRRRGLPRRGHGAHRGGRGALRRLLVRAAADHARGRRARDRAGVDRRPGPPAGGARADERPVRAQGRRALRARGEPPGVAHRPVRLQGHRACPSPGPPRGSCSARRSPACARRASFPRSATAPTCPASTPWR